MQKSLKKKLEDLVEQPVKWDCPLASFTSFHIGGPAHAVVVVNSEDELLATLRFIREYSFDWRIIGKGTNLLVNDRGFQGIVLVLGPGFRYVKVDDKTSDEAVHMRVGGGYGLTKLSNLCVSKGYGGLEFACGIPGSVGGALIMNAGAWGRSMEDIVHSATFMTANGRLECKKDELEFRYRAIRNKELKQGNFVVVEVIMTLHREKSQQLKEQVASYLKKRRSSQPLNLPNAGSIFKNPPKESAGRLIEASGLKGLKVGGAEISSLHANFIVNNGRAKAVDVLTLMNIIQEKVKKDSRIELEPEVHIL
jgi:UDP-N-acetylmuramate dehydrogenase